MFERFFRKPKEPRFGNKHTGDLTLKHNVLHIERVVGNWVYGFVPGLQCYFTAKVHAVPSNKRHNPFRDRGINDGRISRLWISRSREDQDLFVNFDAGSWIMAPEAAKERTVLAVLLASWA